MPTRNNDQHIRERRLRDLRQHRWWTDRSRPTEDDIVASIINPEENNDDDDDTEVTSEEDLINDREALLYILKLQRKLSSKSSVREDVQQLIRYWHFFPEMHRHFACSEDSERLLLV